jgi:hypothetical protein
LYPCATVVEQLCTFDLIQSSASHPRTLVHARSAYEKALKSEGKGTGELITTEIKAGETFFHAEESHQQYLAKPGNRQYCSAQPTEVQLPDFAEWAPADLKEKYAPKFPDVFWAEHGPKPLCTIAGPHSQIKWPPA